MLVVGLFNAGESHMDMVCHKASPCDMGVMNYYLYPRRPDRIKTNCKPAFMSSPIVIKVINYWKLLMGTQESTQLMVSRAQTMREKT